MCITIESSLLIYATTLGYGAHTWDIPPNLDDIAQVLLLLNVAGTFSVTAAIWSKTSFAFTLLRLTNGWMKAVVWFIIISLVSLSRSCSIRGNAFQNSKFAKSLLMF